VTNSNRKFDIDSFLSAIDCSGRITFEEFRAAIKSLNLSFSSDEEIKRLFRQFDTTNNGQIDLSEFLQQLKPPMNERRQRAALNLFNAIDVDKDGRLTLADIKVGENAFHPLFDNEEPFHPS
jgi:Ca2+-binding EF-hand superfamily protein